MARTLDRLAATLVPTLSQPGQRIPLPLGIMAAKYTVRLTGTYNSNSGGGATNVVPYEDSPYNLLSQVQLVLSGSFPLRQHDFRFLRFLNRIQNGTDDRFTAPNGTASTASNFVAEGTIDLEQHDLIPPLDRAFWLDTRRLSRLEAVFDVQGALQLAPAGGGATAPTITSPQIVVTTKEVQDRGGPTSRMQETRMQYPALAVGDNDLSLTALGPAYRGIAIHALSGSATATLVGGSAATYTDPNIMSSDDTIVNTVSLIADNIRLVDQKPWATIQQENKGTFQQETWPAGWAVLDFAKSKNLQDIVQTGNRRTLTLRINIASLPTNPVLVVYPLSAIILTTQQGGVVLPATRKPVVVSRRR
jgi:hypothetical protein